MHRYSSFGFATNLLMADLPRQVSVSNSHLIFRHRNVMPPIFLPQLSSSQSQAILSKFSLIKCALQVVWRCIYSLASKGCHVYELC